MKTKKIIVNIFIVIAFAMIAYTLAAYVFLQSEMTPDMIKLSGTVNTIGNSLILSLFIVGMYHLYLLSGAMQILTGKIRDSLLFIIIMLSTLMLFADLVILSEIGKEYLLFDVTAEWIMLYSFAALHILAMIWGLVAIKKASPNNMKLLEALSRRNEALFLSVHHISLISGILGVCGVIFAQTGLLVPVRYSSAFTILLAGLALAPLAIIIIYWILKMRKKPVKEWMDEKQVSDTALSGLISSLCGVVIYIVVFVLDVFALIAMPISFWLLLVFFIQLIVFSVVITASNKLNEPDIISENSIFKRTVAWIYMLTMLTQSVLWLVLSIMTISKSEEFFPQTMIGILMIGDAIAFGVFAFLYKNKRILTKILILSFLSANLILTFTDQMGLIDYAVLVLNIIVITCYIVLIFKSKKVSAA